MEASEIFEQLRSSIDNLGELLAERHVKVFQEFQGFDRLHHIDNRRIGQFGTATH